MRILLSTFLILLILVGCKSSKATCDAYSFKWYSDSDTLLVEKDGKLFLPMIPSLEAKEFHLSDPPLGKYTIFLLNQGKIVEVQSMTVR